MGKTAWVLGFLLVGLAALLLLLSEGRTARPPISAQVGGEPAHPGRRAQAAGRGQKPSSTQQRQPENPGLEPLAGGASKAPRPQSPAPKRSWDGWLTVLVKDVPARQPIEGAHVEAFPEPGTAPRRWRSEEEAVAESFTDAWGRAEMALDPGDYRIVVDHRHFHRAGQKPLKMGDSPQTLSIRLRPGALFQGRVLAPDRFPVAAGRVCLFRMDGGRSGCDSTDAEGSFALLGELEGEGPYRVVAVVPPHPLEASQPLQAVPDAPAIEIVLRRPSRAARFTGRVTEEEGRAIAGAKLILESQQPVRDKAWLRYKAQLSGQALIDFMIRFWSYWDFEYETDQEGRFEIEVEARADERVTVEFLGYRPVVADIDLSRDVQRDFRLSPYARLQVTVLDRYGAPMEGMTVVGVVPGPRREHSLSSLGEPGWYYIKRFPVEVFAYDLEHGRGVTPRVSVQYYLPEIVLQQGSATIRGRVLDQSGRPVPRFGVTYYHAEDRSYSGNASKWFSTQDGVFEVPYVPDGPARLSVGFSDAVQRIDISTFDIATGKEITVVLPPSRRKH